MQKQVDKMNTQEKENLLKQILQDLKEILSEERYLHSISTMKKAKELANKYNKNEQIVMLTALAHDIAKEMSNKEYFEYSKQNNIYLDEIDKIENIALHGKIGADIVKNRYGFTKEMQDAICYHTTGRANMTLLDKIIYLADKSEDRRKEESVEKLRDMIETEGLDISILWDIDYYIIPKLIENKKVIHVNTIYARNDIISRLK